MLVGVSPGRSSTGERGHDFSAIVAPGEIPIQNAKDLVGKTVAVNNLNNIGDTSVRAGVRAAGGDPKQVKFIEVPFPDMPAALAEHRIEAGWVVEPDHRVAARRQSGGLESGRRRAENDDRGLFHLPGEIRQR